MNGVLTDVVQMRVETHRDVGPQTAVAWFYQVLGNDLFERARRAGASVSALKRLAKEFGDEREPASDTRGAICRCTGRLAARLKPEHAAAISAVEVNCHSLADFARISVITPNTSAVSVHRAREALKKQIKACCCGSCAGHGCLDCTCVSNNSLAAV